MNTIIYSSYTYLEAFSFVSLILPFQVEVFMFLQNKHFAYSSVNILYLAEILLQIAHFVNP